jgi:hypothetical protein
MSIQSKEDEQRQREAYTALADAQALLRDRGPTSAVDRVHTGLHDFLKAACNEKGITYLPDPTATQLSNSC